METIKENRNNRRRTRRAQRGLLPLTETGMKPIVLEQERFVGGISRIAEHNGNRHRRAPLFTKAARLMRSGSASCRCEGKPSLDDVIFGTTDKELIDGPDPEAE